MPQDSIIGGQAETLCMKQGIDIRYCFIFYDVAWMQKIPIFLFWELKKAHTSASGENIA